MKPDRIYLSTPVVAASAVTACSVAAAFTRDGREYCFFVIMQDPHIRMASRTQDGVETPVVEASAVTACSVMAAFTRDGREYCFFVIRQTPHIRMVR